MSGKTFWCDWPRDFLSVTGADAHAYLGSQLSQDIAELRPRTAAWSYLLQPNGKVDALVRVTRLSDDAFVVDVDGGYGAAVLVRLDRFRIRVKVELDPLPWRCLAVRGPDAADAARGTAERDGDRALVVGSWWLDASA